MRIQLISDTHFNKTFDKHVFAEADMLICAGDIIDSCDIVLLRKIFCYIRPLYKHILFVPGNHEFFSKHYNHAPQYMDVTSYEHVNDLLKSVCDYYGVYYLNNYDVTIEDILFVGSTLWSKIPSGSYGNIYKRVCDYNFITGLTCELSNAIHDESVKYINRQLTYPTPCARKTVVITHHAPLLKETGDPKFEGDVENCAFVSDLSAMVHKADVWIYGHTHYSNSFEHGTCNVISNCYKAHKKGHEYTHLGGLTMDTEKIDILLLHKKNE